MPKRVFLDDIRYPVDDTWEIVRSTEQAKQHVLDNGVANEWSFDHDLGGDDTAVEFIKWLIDTDIDSGGSFIPHDFKYCIHSANPVGSANIKGLLNGYLLFRKNNV